MNFGLDKLRGNLDKLAKLPRHYRIIAIFAIPAVLVGLYFQVVHGPARAELKALQGKQKNIQRKLNEVRSVAANIEAFEAELDNLGRELEIAVRQLPNSKELPGLLTDITTLGKNAGLEFKAFRPKAEIRRGFYSEVPIDIEFSGDFHEIATFLDRVAKLPRIVNIRKLEMSVKKESIARTTLKVTGRATTFRFIEGGGAT